MNRKIRIPTTRYLQAEVRKARLTRDLAVAQYILDGAERVALAVRAFVARLFPAGDAAPRAALT